MTARERAALETMREALEVALPLIKAAHDYGVHDRRGCRGVWDCDHECAVAAKTIAAALRQAPLPSRKHRR